MTPLRSGVIGTHDEDINFAQRIVSEHCIPPSEILWLAYCTKRATFYHHQSSIAPIPHQQETAMTEPKHDTSNYVAPGSVIEELELRCMGEFFICNR